MREGQSDGSIDRMGGERGEVGNEVEREALGKEKKELKVGPFFGPEPGPGLACNSENRRANGDQWRLVYFDALALLQISHRSDAAVCHGHPSEDHKAPPMPFTTLMYNERWSSV